jgi:hypothetical protein
MSRNVGTVRWLFSEKARRQGEPSSLVRSRARRETTARRGRCIYLASFSVEPRKRFQTSSEATILTSTHPPSATYFEICSAVFVRSPRGSHRRASTRSNINSLNRLTSTNRTEHRESLRKRKTRASRRRVAGTAQTTEDIVLSLPTWR